jgi:hypothetical protein
MALIMGNKLKDVLAVCLLVVIFGCSKVMPAGFWRTYHKKEIDFKDTDQGPWGGYSIVEWRVKEPINRTGLLLFAKSNGWKLVDSIDLGAWGAGHNQVIPFQDTIPDQLFNGDEHFVQFLGMIEQPSMMYIFSSGWMRTTDEVNTENNGFLLISKDNHRLAVYHKWGE